MKPPSDQTEKRYLRRSLGWVLAGFVVLNLGVLLRVAGVGGSRSPVWAHGMVALGLLLVGMGAWWYWRSKKLGSAQGPCEADPDRGGGA